MTTAREAIPIADVSELLSAAESLGADLKKRTPFESTADLSKPPPTLVDERLDFGDESPESPFASEDPGEEQPILLKDELPPIPDGLEAAPLEEELAEPPRNTRPRSSGQSGIKDIFSDIAPLPRAVVERARSELGERGQDDIGLEIDEEPPENALAEEDAFGRGEADFPGDVGPGDEDLVSPTPHRSKEPSDLEGMVIPVREESLIMQAPEKGRGLQVVLILIALVGVLAAAVLLAGDEMMAQLRGLGILGKGSAPELKVPWLPPEAPDPEDEPAPPAREQDQEEPEAEPAGDPEAAPAPEPAKETTVRIVARPAKARITVDGRPIENGAEISIKDRPRRLRVKARNCKTKTLDLKPGAKGSVEVVLSCKAGKRPRAEPPTTDESEE